MVTLPAERAASTSGFVDLEPLARAHGIAVRRCADLNSAESVRHVRDLRPDLMVVTGWTRLLSAELLGVPPRGVVGFHASLLPRYRGRAPVNWAILRGEATTGNTMMYLDAGTDTGDIIDQQTVPIAPDDTCATVYARVGEAGAEMLRRHLRGAARRHRRPASAGSRATARRCRSARRDGDNRLEPAGPRGPRLDPRPHLPVPRRLHASWRGGSSCCGPRPWTAPAPERAAG